MIDMAALTCIVCPRSCKLQIEAQDGIYTVNGNGCKRGYTFAVNEMTNPMRTISSTVSTVFPDVPVLPVRVSAEIPKSAVFDVMREINRTVVQTRIGRGETVIRNVLNLGVDVIATSNILKETKEKGELS